MPTREIEVIKDIGKIKGLKIQNGC